MSVLLLVPALWAAAGTDGTVSHIGPHLRSANVRQLNIPATAQIPSNLATDLADGNVEKGYSANDEATLAGQLLGAGLRHNILRVAVVDYNGASMALVKLQASDTKSKRFDAIALQEDTVTALCAAFALRPNISSVDVWAVVPSNGNQDYAHTPVFSVSATRDKFEQALSQPRSAAALLSELGMVRISPIYAQYAFAPLADILGLIPTTAFRDPPLQDKWPQLIASAQERVSQTPNASVQILQNRVNGGHTNAALTIDDGPHPLTTPLMLAVLRHYGVHATFFLVGQKAEQYPELVRRIANDGHEIGNHTYSHRRASELSGAEVLAEVSSCQDVLEEICGVRTRFFRPPGGRVTPAGLRALAISNHAVTMWTDNANDWLKPAPEVIAQNVLASLRPGSIVLMHQGSLESFHALPMIIEGAARKGVKLGTVSELVDSGGGRIANLSLDEALKYMHDCGYDDY